MTEWLWRKGVERVPRNEKVPWWAIIAYSMYPSYLEMLGYEYRHFIELVNEQGKIRRIYVNYD